MHALSIIGKPLMKKLPWIPFPIMSSTGRHIVFATCLEKESKVDVYLVDSSVSLQATEKDCFGLNYYSTEKNLFSTSIVSYSSLFSTSIFSLFDVFNFCRCVTVIISYCGPPMTLYRDKSSSQ